MADEDIYGSKRQYGTIVKKIREGTYLQPDKKTKYFIKNPANQQYFLKLLDEFDYKDQSYIRRIQYLKALRKTASVTNKDFKEITREDVKKIVAHFNQVHKTANTRRDFIHYNQSAWKVFLPEKDAQGRPDDSIIPYPWRISRKEDRSRQKKREDFISAEEYRKIISSLSDDVRTQCFFSMMFETLARPQELCYLNVGNVTLYEKYARVSVTEHGKEGTKELQVISGYYYLSEWLNKHPQKHDPKAPLFVTMSNASKDRRLTPKATNKILRGKLKKLGLNKSLTNYSLKRSGVSARYFNGEPAQNIQKIAGWTSTNQLKTYDLTEQRDFLDQELIIKGLKESNGNEEQYIVEKTCPFCHSKNAYDNAVCYECKRPLSKKVIEEELQEKESLRLKVEELELTVHRDNEIRDRARKDIPYKEAIKEVLKEMIKRGELS